MGKEREAEGEKTFLLVEAVCLNENWVIWERNIINIGRLESHPSTRTRDILKEEPES